MKKNIILVLILSGIYSLSYGKELPDYIQYLQQNNLDIKKYELTLKQAELNYNGTKIDGHPSINSSIGSNNVDNNPSIYSFNTSLSYDLDLWGKLKDNEKAKLFQVEMAKQNLLDIKNQIIYKFIDSYLQLAAINEKIKIEMKKLNKYQEKLSILEIQFKNDFITLDKLLVVKNNIADIKNNISTLGDNKNTIINNINVLLNNKTDESILDEPQTFNDIVTINKTEKNILTVIENNPTIKSALLKVISNDHLIKYNEKSYYPTITLGGSLTESALKISNLLTNPILTILSSINFNFNFNQIHNNIELSKTNKYLAQNEYQSSYLSLFNNIKETINKYQNNENSFLTSNKEVKNYQNMVNLYSTQYKSGILLYTNLLDQEILLLNSKENNLNYQLLKQQQLNKLNYYIN